MDDSHENLSPIKMHKYLMTLTGIWPYKNSSLLYNLKYTVNNILYYSCMATMFYELYNLRDNYREFQEHFTLVASLTAYLIKEVCFVWKRDNFYKLQAHLDLRMCNDYPIDLRNHMQRATKISSITSKVFQYMCGTVLILYALKPVLIENQDLPVRFSVHLGFYAWVFVYAWQLFTIGYCIWNNSSLDLLVGSLMNIASAHFSIIHDRLITVGQEDILTEAGINKKIRQCIEQHTSTIKLVELIQITFSWQCLAQFLHSCIIVCNIVFQLAVIKPPMLEKMLMMFYFNSMMIQLAIYCWFGNEVIYRSMHIRNACYLSNWYCLGENMKKSLYLIMERTKRPVYISAGGFADLSLASYGNVIRSSYSFFALMQRLYSK